MAKNIKRRYSEEETKLILENWWDPDRRPMVIQKTGRSAYALNFYYYRLLRQMGKDPAQHKSEMLEKEQRIFVPKAEQPSGIEPTKEIEYVYDEDVNKRLEALDERLSKIESALSTLRSNFEGHVNRVDSLINNLVHIYNKGDELGDVTAILREKNAIETELKALREAYEKDKAYNTQLYNELDFWLGQFFRLSSVEKIATLADFLPKMKAVVDKYGTVLGITSDKKGDERAIMRRAQEVG